MKSEVLSEKDYGISDALETLGIKEINNGVCTGTKWFNTAGEIIESYASADGNLIALDSRTGKYLWHFQTGARIISSPISYAVDGKQYIAIAAGANILSFGLT